MLLFLAQGGAMAMEDGYVLADVLRRKSSDIPSALKDYELLRRERTTRVQLGSRARADICQVISPLAQLRRDLGYLFNQWFKPGAAIQRADWIYSYDVASVTGGAL
jgi:salicylate hydroxylase